MATRQQMAPVRLLERGDESDTTRGLQAATNRRLRSRDLDALTVAENGVLDDRTLDAVRKAAWALGASEETYESITRDGVVRVGVQRMIRNPGRRTDEQRSRGKARMARLRAIRKKRAEEARTTRSRAVSAFLAKVGTREQPAGSNGGGIITAMEAFFGLGRVPWCGVACGYHAAKFGGVAGLRSDVAAVLAIEKHARNGVAPYGRWQSSPEGALPGSFVVIGGSGVHVGMLVQPLSGGRARTVEGNTSFGPGGSQSNGGCIAVKARSAAEITGVATMVY